MAGRLSYRARAVASSVLVLAVLAATAQAAPQRGTAGDDRLRGTARADVMRGYGGRDALIGKGGADRLLGGAGGDYVLGMDGNDIIRGDGGSDVLNGAGGRDVIDGGPGADTLVGGTAGDRLRGGTGRDVIRTRFGGRDRIDCGPGRDTAVVDTRDVVVRCEVVRGPRPASPARTTPQQSLPPTTAPAPAAAPAVDSPPLTSPPADPADPADPEPQPPAFPPPPPTLPPDDYPQLLAAGDIADCTDPAEQTATLLDALRGTVTPLGDTAYPSGTVEDFVNCYEPTWGRHRHRTRPAVGDHEYDTPGAEPFWQYFGASAGEAGKGWYSYDLGSWHVVVLNTVCAQVGGCGEGSEQLEWLREDLAANPALCTAAYWHTPRYSSGKKHGDNLDLVPFWQALYEHGVEFVMSGNDHHYERFAPQSPYGDLDPTDGIRQFVVGTGGRFLRPVTTVPEPSSETRNDTTHGILRVGLLEGSYEWEFVPVEGGTYADSGSTGCH